VSGRAVIASMVSDDETFVHSTASLCSLAEAMPNLSRGPLLLQATTAGLVDASPAEDCPSCHGAGWAPVRRRGRLGGRGRAVSGRTNFWPKSADWLHKPAIMRAGVEHGPIALVVLDFLICEARKALPFDGDGGSASWVVSADCWAIARAATFGHCTADEIRELVRGLAGLGLLERLDEEPTGESFKCSIPLGAR
jgi:hypothetical protein